MNVPQRKRFATRPRRGRRPILPLLALVAGLLVVTGCRSAGETVAVSEDGTPQATPSGVQSIVTRIVERITVVTSTPDPLATPEVDRPPVELDLSLNGELPNLDPGLPQSQSQLDLIQNLFIGLTNYNPDTNVIEPEYATSWSTTPDGLIWTFNLRDDVYWVRPSSPRPGSDDLWSVSQVRPVTADDVVFAVQRACSREVETSLTFALFIIEGCEEVFTTLEVTESDLAKIGVRAIDPTMLEIRLTEAAGYFLTLTSMPFFKPIPRDLATEMGNEWLDPVGEYSSGWQTPDNLVTSGPFFPVPTQTTSQSLVLHRNPLWPLSRPGNVEVVNVFFFDDDMDAFEMWEDRQLDIALLPTSEREQFLTRSQAKARVIPDQVLFYIGFDFGSQVFREPEVRRAFSAAIDRQRLLDELYNGRGLTMRHATVPQIVAAVPVDEVGVGYSPDYARQQMSASTFRSCRLLPEVRLLVSSADLSLLQAEIIRDMWVEELECLEENIHIEQVNFGQLLAGTRQDATGRPDMWELAWAPIFPDAHNLLNDLLHCRDSENRQNRECSEADNLMSRASTVVNPGERASLYRQAESLFFNENGVFPIAPLYIRARDIIVHDWVIFPLVAFGGQQWDRITIDPVLKELERSR